MQPDPKTKLVISKKKFNAFQVQWEERNNFGLFNQQKLALQIDHIKEYCKRIESGTSRRKRGFIVPGFWSVLSALLAYFSLNPLDNFINTYETGERLVVIKFSKTDII